MKKIRFNKNHKKGFTLVEMLIVSIIALVVLVSIPILIFSRRNNLSMNSSHGEYECFYDNNAIKDTIHSQGKETFSKITGTGCNFTPPVGVKKFIVQVIPASGGGANAYLENVEANTEITNLQDLDIFNVTNLDENIGTQYSVTYPTLDGMRALPNINGFLSDDNLVDIRDTVATELSKHSLTVNIKAPNGVKPIMQYYRPNIDYPHYRGMLVFGDGSMASNYISNLSFLPWPNLIRYSEIGLFPVRNSKENYGGAIPTFKEMFVKCSEEFDNGHNLDGVIEKSCYDQCADSLKDTKIGNSGDEPTKVQADPLAPLFLKCDNGAADCLNSQEKYNVKKDNKEEEETFDELPLPLYGRTMMVVIKESNDVRDTMFNFFAGLFTKVAKMCEGASNDGLLNLTKIGRGIADNFASANDYFTNLSDAVSKLKESHRVTTYRNENANLKMQNPIKGEADVNFKNPSKQCNFTYQYYDNANYSTITATVLNPEVDVDLREDNACSVSFQQQKGNNTFTVTDAMCKNEYPNRHGFQYPRGKYICGVATPDQYPKISVVAECKEYWNPCIEYDCLTKLCILPDLTKCKKYYRDKYGKELCLLYNNPSLSVDYTDGFYNIEDSELEILGANYNAPVFQARCYAPYIFDKQTLYVREMAPDGGDGGYGAAKQIKRSLMDGLSINFQISDKTNGSWGSFMIPDDKKPTTDNRPYTADPYKITSDDHTRIFAGNHTAKENAEGSMRIWGIRSGMCDGTYDRYVNGPTGIQYPIGIQSITEKSIGAMVGDGINKGALITRQYNVQTGCSNSVDNVETCDGVRGESIQVNFSTNQGLDATFNVRAGSAGTNTDTIDELPINLLAKQYAANNLDETMVKMENMVKDGKSVWDNIKSIFQEGKPRPGMDGTYTGSTLSAYTVTDINKIENGVYNGGDLNTDLNGTSSTDAEINILKTQGGGSARLVCDYLGNARSHYFTGKEQNPNIEIIPGRIWLRFPTVGTDGINGAIGDSAQKVSEHTGIVKAQQSDNKIFNITLGQGGAVFEKKGATCDGGERKVIHHPNIILHPGQEIGFYCAGQEGGETTVAYNNKPISFSMFNSDGIIKGGKGGDGARTFEAGATENEHAKWKNSYGSGHGSFSIFGGNRIFVQLFFGNDDPTCIFDSIQDGECDANSQPEEDDDDDKKATTGQGAKVRIIW